jgi:gliding motility-associated-like protein
MKKIIICICLTIFSLSSIGQGEANTWYMGQGIGLDFSTDPPTLTDGFSDVGMDGANAELEAFSTISNGDGEFLFAVAGKDIYDSDLNKRGVLPDGSNYHLAQGSQIIKIPGSTNEYYIISVPMGNAGSCTSPPPSYTKVTVNGTSGNNITIASSQQFDLPNVSGGQMILPVTDNNGNPTGDNWIIFHGVNNNEFHVYKMSVNGTMTFEKKINQGPSASVAVCGNSTGDVSVMLKSNGCYNQFVMNYGSQVNLFDFDAENGDIIFGNSTGPINEAYGVEFSPSGKNVFVSTGTWLSGPKIFKLPVSPGGMGSILGAATQIGTPSGSIRGGSMQLAPDGKIYVGGFSSWGDAYNKTEYIGTISDPDGAGVYDPQAIALDDPRHIGMGMPTFMASLVSNILKIIPDPKCEGQESSFDFNLTGLEQTPPDRSWKFYNNTTATGIPIGTSTNKIGKFTWPDAGSFAVTLEVKDACGRTKYDTVIVDIDEFATSDANIDYSSCPKPTLTGINADSDQYKLYDEDPLAGGNLLGVGKIFEVDPNTSYWIAPAGNVTVSNINDPRTVGNWLTSSGNTSLIIADGTASISNVDAAFGNDWATTRNGDFVFTLKDAGGATVGTPVTVNFSGAGGSEELLSASPVDWVIPAGTYSISINSPGWAKMRPLTPNNSTVGSISFNGGQASGITINHVVEDAEITCYEPKKINVGSCCSKPSDDAVIDLASSTLEVCENLTGDVVSVSGLTDGLDFKWQESVDGSTWTDISGESGDISGGVITLTPVSVDQQWYRYLIAEDGNIETCAKESDSVQFIINPLPLIDSIGLTPFKSIYCEGEAHILEAHLDESAGYPVTYEWKLEGLGLDSVTDGITTSGIHNYKVVVDSKGCLDSMSIDVDVAVNESADITDTQGPWCVNDNSPIITTESGTTLGGDWSVEFTDNGTIDVATGELTLIDSGDVKIYYKTKGACFGIDSVVITIEPAMIVDFVTTDLNFCLKDTVFQLDLTPTTNTGGRWSCRKSDESVDNGAVNATGSFNSAGLLDGDYILKYAMDGFNTACSDSDSITITINPLDTAEIINLPSLCNSDPAIQLQLNPSLTVTGTWADSLGGTTYIDASGLFDPAGLTDGQVMVIFKTDGACGYSDTAYVTVTSNIEYSMDHITDEYCLNADQDTILVSPGGGTFWTTSGEGIVDADYGYWDPKLYSSDGIDTIWYGKAGACGDTVFIEVTLNPIDLVEIDSAVAVCADEAAFDYTLSGASTTDGTWSGTGITDGVLGTFDPATAGAGIHTIAYQSPNTCFVIDSVQILVKPRIGVSIDSLALPFCGASTALSATGNLHLGLGRWEKSASWPSDWDAGKTENDSILTFDPNVVTPGIDSIFYMIDANAFVCGDTATLLIGISPMEVAEIDTVTEVCSSYAPFDYTLSPLSTPNGTWSGVGIVDGLLGTFDPALAGPGIHTIRYKTPGVCFVWDSLTITVVQQEIVSLTGGQNYCGNALPGLIEANKAGGVFFGGWDVAALGVVNDSSRTFAPTLAGGTGVDSIFYGIDAQCGDTAWLEIAIDTVDIPDIDGANESAFCQTDNPKVVTLMSTATPGGVWQDFGGGNALITTGGLFDPSIGEGLYQVVYTTPGTCFTTDTHSIEVVSEIIVDVDKTLSDTVFCNNASPYDLTSFLLPTTSGDGSGSWKITPFISGGVVSNNQLVPTALVPGVYSLKYALGTGACSDSDSVSIRILPILDPTIDNEPAADVCVSLKNYQFNNSGDNGGVWSVDPSATIDVVTGDLTLTEGTFEVKYRLGTTCPVDSTVKIVVQEPNDPTIQDPGVICGYDAAFALVTTGDAGGTWSGPGVSGTNFDPAVSGEGTFAVNYAFTGTCPIDSTFDFVVDPILDPTIDNEPAEDICIADGSYAFTTSGDIGGTWSIDNGGVIDPSTGVMNLTKGGVFDVTYKHTGCPVEDMVTIEVTTPGNPDFNPAGSFCENLPVYQLSQPLTSGGVWSSLPIAGAVNPVTGEFDPGVAGPGNHDVTYTLEGACPAFDTETIVVDDLPDWDYVIPNANGCEPYTTSMIVVSQGSLPGTTTWSFTDGLVSTINGSLDSLTHTFVNDGCYNGTAVVAFENGCIDSVTKTNAVCVNPVPIADFDWGPKTATVLEPFIQFEDLSIDADSWNWDLGRVSTTNIPPNPTASTLQNPFVTYGSPDSGTYTVELIAWNGMCSDTLVKRITILDNFTVFVPNAFTPDGDGLNDIFFPNGKNHDNLEGASEYSFLIFNRWGALIWESGTPYQPWDGTNAKTGSEVQQDVYVWKLKVWDNVESVLKTYYGRVSLIR